MPIALRRSKTFPVWLALIAAVAGIAAVAAVIVTAVLSAHHPADTAAGATERARMQQAMLAQTPSSGTPVSSISGITDGNAGGDTSGNAAPTPTVASTSGGTTDATAAMATASTDSGDGTGSAASAQRLSNDPSALSATSSTGSAHRSRVSAARVAAARRKADAARDGNSLRADIARYNAERGANLTTQQLVPLRTAVVPAGHSLWDDVPAPLSDVYHN